jgi:hypothetical protein
MQDAVAVTMFFLSVSAVAIEEVKLQSVISSIDNYPSDTFDAKFCTALNWSMP